MLGELKVAAREVGNLPLSIPTSEAIESLCSGDVKETQIFINVRVLFRNMYSSLDTTVRDTLKGSSYVDIIIQEMQFLRSYIAEKKMGALKVVFYQCSYTDLNRKLPSAHLKTANTAKQRIYAAAEQEAMALLQKQAEALGIQQYVTEIRGEGSVIIFTHSPVDLLFARFFSVVLLESHTGKLKKSFEWNTKLTNGSTLTNLPFNKFTVQIFGDNNTYIAAMPSNIKRTVLEMAEQDRWSATSSDDRIRMSVNKLKDHFAKNFLLKVLKS